jgi:predicted transcriptional regulator
MKSKSEGWDVNRKAAPQLSLDFTVRARRSDPATSHASAARVSRKIAKLNAHVLRCLCDAGERGLTSYELATVSGRERVSVSPTLRPLADRGFVLETDARRPGPSGHPGIVWKIAPLGLTVLEEGQ